MKWQIQQDAWYSARIAYVSQHCIYKNCPQIIGKEQWQSNNSIFEYHGDTVSGDDK